METHISSETRSCILDIRLYFLNLYVAQVTLFIVKCSNTEIRNTETGTYHHRRHKLHRHHRQQ